MNLELSQFLAANAPSNIKNQSILVGRKIILGTLRNPLSDTTLLYATAFISKQIKGLEWCQGSAELALPATNHDATGSNDITELP